MENLDFVDHDGNMILTKKQPLFWVIFFNHQMLPKFTPCKTFFLLNGVNLTKDQQILNGMNCFAMIVMWF